MKRTLKNGLTVAGALFALVAGAGNAFAGWSGTAFQTTDDDPSGKVKRNHDSIYNTDTVNAHVVVFSLGAATSIPNVQLTYTIRGFNPGGTITCTFEVLDLFTLAHLAPTYSGSTSMTGFYQFPVTINQLSVNHPGEWYLYCSLPPATAGNMHYLQSVYLAP
jgi:hypothetical protein